MSEATFEGYVEKQQLQFKNPQNIENRKLASMAHNTSNPSYTQHVSQLLYVAINMARKKHPEFLDLSIDELYNLIIKVQKTVQKKVRLWLQ